MFIVSLKMSNPLIVQYASLCVFQEEIDIFSSWNFLSSCCDPKIFILYCNLGCCNVIPTGGMEAPWRTVVIQLALFQNHLTVAHHELECQEVCDSLESCVGAGSYCKSYSAVTPSVCFGRE